MPAPVPAPEVTTAGGFLLVLALFVPVLGALGAFTSGGRHVERVAAVTIALGLASVSGIVAGVLQSGTPLVYLLGGWAPPIGIALRADGPAVVMMAMAAGVVALVGVFAYADFHTPAAMDEARRPFAFWILLMGVWAGLNAVFLAGDLFTLYVALELLTFAAVPLVSLDGRAETLAAALRYLLFALVGSILYLAGAGLIYGDYGTLDIVLLAGQVRADPATCAAVALMTVGLLAKTALFPLHLWLPPAHAGAPAAASAVLSALVVKGSFFIVVRLWFDVLPGLPGWTAAQLVAALGAAAILFGNLVALRQARLKLLIAYSTVAQIGYLFLMFPLALGPGARIEHGGALTGGILQAMSHATAKAAMFMAAGLIYTALGHDRIAGLAGVGRALPVSVLAFALGGLALMGVPPSGAYTAKALLVHAAGESGQWWWELVLDAGGFLTSAYLIVVLAHALAPAREPLAPLARVPLVREAAALALALCSLSLGLIHWAAVLPDPSAVLSSPLTAGSFAKMLWPLLGGTVLAGLFGRWRDRPPRLGGVVDRTDLLLRHWPVAGLLLLLLLIALNAAILAAGGGV
jgi:formate hydrogenlyase subunit 3/multisubunit Na+/H+ antiporter MnhD subunit